MEKEINWIIKEKYGGKIKKKLKKDIERLKKGEPVDYIIGFSNFLNCKINLSSRVFIPEPETEFWVEKAIKEIKDKKVSCLDLFSGSGCIGIAVLKNTKNTKVDFAEIDKNLLRQIKKNLETNKIEKKRYNIFCSDVFSDVEKKYDYIFANPPYISEKRIDNVQKSVLDFEPKKALFGGEDGLKYIKIFLKNVSKYLKKRGKAYVEFDSFQKRKIEKITDGLEFHKDQYGKWRFLTIKAKK